MWILATDFLHARDESEQIPQPWCESQDEDHYLEEVPEVPILGVIVYQPQHWEYNRDLEQEHGLEPKHRKEHAWYYMLLHVAELGERAQDPPRGRARDIGGDRRLRQRHRRPLLAEAAEHGEPLGKGRHELLVVGAGGAVVACQHGLSD